MAGKYLFVVFVASVASLVFGMDNDGGVFKLNSIPDTMLKDDNTMEDIEVEIGVYPELIKKVEDLEKKIEKMEEERSRDRKKLDNVEDLQRTEIRKMRKKPSKEPAGVSTQMGQSMAQRGLKDPVAFTVHFKRDPVIQLKDNDTLKYDAIVTNSHPGYYPRSGIFSAPVSGLYHFYISVMCTEGKYIEIMLKVQDKIVASAHASGNRRKWYDSGSSAVVVYMEAGQRAWVEKCCGHVKMRGKAHSVFTGFLLN